MDGFCKRRGSDFEGGLVLRKFVNLKKVTDSNAGRPVTDEWRAFWIHGRVVAIVPGFENVTRSDPPNIDFYRDLASKIDSPLFTMDIAQLEDGGQVVIELGDGQVAGLPEEVDCNDFYQTLYASMTGSD